MGTLSSLVGKHHLTLAGFAIALVLVAWGNSNTHAFGQYFPMFFQYGGVSLTFAFLITGLAYPVVRHQALLWIPLGLSFHLVGNTLEEWHTPAAVVLWVIPPLQSLLIGLLLFRFFSLRKLARPVLISLFFSTAFIMTSHLYDNQLFYIVFFWAGVALPVEYMIRTALQTAASQSS